MASREPFSRYAGRASRGRSDGHDQERAADYAAATYGWGPGDLDRITDEQLVAYFDAAQDRIERQSRTEFERLVEATRLGYGFLHDARAYARWRARVYAASAITASDGGGLIGAELDATIERLATRRPDLVMAAAA